MEPEEDGSKNGGPGFGSSTTEIGAGGSVRAMSVDMPDADDVAVVNETNQGKPCVACPGICAH
jgi:hypothetical protein